MTDLRTIERDSIRAFVQSAADEGYLSGRVLDYGCGKQPYRDIVEAGGGEYNGYDRMELPASTAVVDVGYDDLFSMSKLYDAILCTQVLQYVREPSWYLGTMQRILDPDNGVALHGGSEERGHLVLTYPTNWPEVEPEDLHRFTKAGMERLLTEAGFTIIRHESRAVIFAKAETFFTGYGVIARA